MEEEVKEYNEKVQEVLDEINYIVDEIREKTEKLNGYFEISYGDWVVARRRFKFGTGYVSDVVVRFMGKAIPERAEDLGEGYSAYGDYNNYIEYIDIDDIDDAIETISNFVDVIKEHLRKQTEKYTEMSKKLEKISLS